jgi:hypothetical protein
LAGFDVSTAMVCGHAEGHACTAAIAGGGRGTRAPAFASGKCLWNALLSTGRFHHFLFCVVIKVILLLLLLLLLSLSLSLYI